MFFALKILIAGLDGGKFNENGSFKITGFLSLN